MLDFLVYSVSANAQTEKECFEKVSRGVFKFNQGFDKVILKPIAKGYNKLPEPIRKVLAILPLILQLYYQFLIIFCKEIRLAGHATEVF